MLECFRIADDAYGGGGACLDSYHEGFVGEKSVAAATEGAEAFTQSAGDEFGHPEMEWGTDDAWLVGGLRQGGCEFAVYEVCHALCRGCLAASSLYPALAFEVFLEFQHGEWGGW